MIMLWGREIDAFHLHSCKVTVYVPCLPYQQESVLRICHLRTDIKNCYICVKWVRSLRRNFRRRYKKQAFILFINDMRKFTIKII